MNVIGKMLFGSGPWAVLLVTIAALSSAAGKEDPVREPKRNNSVASTTGTPSALPLNINNFVTWMWVTGEGNVTAQNNVGGRYPRGTCGVIYQDGFIFAGKPYLDAMHTQPAQSQPEVRCGGQAYIVGTRGGRIIGSGAAAVAASPTAPDVRIYRIRRDYASMNDSELNHDAADVAEKSPDAVVGSDLNAIRDGYARDWTEWPVAYGAPYIERNGIPGYQPPPPFSTTFTVDGLIPGNYDEPGIAGSDPNHPADQVMWTVFNDLDSAASRSFLGCVPTGLEFQCSIWGYKRADALGQVLFKKYRVINKGGAIIDTVTGEKGAFYLDSLFFTQWSDPDVGDSGDDLCGCDTTLSLGFAYNGNAMDNEYKQFGLAPAAVGYDFLQGPIVPSPNSNAMFDLRQKPGYKNLPMTSFGFFSAGSLISDPPSTYEGAKRWYRMMQGYVPDPSTWALRLYPSGPFPPSQYPLSGDPVTGMGFVDGLGTSYSYPMGDRRLLLCTGPVALAPGDTQEVVVGVVGGMGSDRLSSLALMKYNDGILQQAYNALFAPAAPVQPTLMSPADSSVVAHPTVTLAWIRPERATHFELQVGCDPFFPAIRLIDSTLTDTVCLLNLSPEKSYYWRVCAASEGGFGPYSPIWSFRVMQIQPGRPELIRPENNAMVNSAVVAFVWRRPAADVTKYWLETSTDSIFSNKTTDSTITDTTCSKEGLPNGVYWWRVRAAYAAGWGEFSDARKLSVDVTGIRDDNKAPSLYSLDQNFPNPFNPATLIRFGLPVGSHVTLIVYNALGQEITTLINETIEAGYHTFRFDGSGLPSGLYLCKLEAGAFAQTRKLLLLR